MPDPALAGAYVDEAASAGGANEVLGHAALVLRELLILVMADRHKCVSTKGSQVANVGLAMMVELSRSDTVLVR